MAKELTLYVMALVAGGTLSLGLSVYAAFRFQKAPGGTYYVLGTLMAALFNFAYLFELTSSSLEQIKFWLRVEYVPLSFLPAFLLLMCCEYTGIRLRRTAVAALFAVPITIIVMQATNDAHHLYYETVRLRDDVPFPIVQLEYGPYFLVHSVFLYGTIAACATLLALRIRKVKSPFRMQLVAMIAGLIVPMSASFVYLGGESPYGIDLGPVFMSVSYVFHCFALFRFQLFNVAPIARDSVFESMEEGVVVLNANDVVVDYNRSALSIIPGLASGKAGKPLANVLVEQKLADILRLGDGSDYEFAKDGVSNHYRIQFSSVRNKKQKPVGKIITFVNITERVRMERRLQQIASEDGLTRLYNRAALLERSGREMRALARTGGSAAAIMFDIDLFKEVNDTFGHEAGDLALMRVADAVRATVRETDVAGRYGGDEFIVFLPNTSAKDARDIAERLRKSVAGSELTAGNRTFRIQSSFGVASVNLSSGDDSRQSLQTLVRDADQALYAAKRSGKNRVSSFG